MAFFDIFNRKSKSDIIPSMKSIQVDSIDIELHRKAIKNLYIRIKPPLGQVTVSVPKRLSDKALMQFITERLPWIKEQRLKFADYQVPLDAQYIDDEKHSLWGELYDLKVIEGHAKHQLVREGDELYLYVRPGTSTKNKALVMEGFYKNCIAEQLTSLVPIWEDRMSVTTPEIRLRTMKTRWGSCRVDGQRIWLNTELAKQSLESLEYVLVHEMVHLFEPSHNHSFKALMDRFMPDWRQRKLLLNNRSL